MRTKCIRASSFIVSLSLLSMGQALAQTPPPSSDPAAVPPPPQTNIIQPPPDQQTMQQGGNVMPPSNGQFGQPQGQFPQGGPNGFNGQQGQQQFNDQMHQQGFSNQDGGGQQQNDERFKRQQEQMLKNAKNGLGRMQKMIATMEKRISLIEKKGGIASDTLKTSIQQAKDLMVKAQAASTMEDLQAAGLDDMHELMQTINDEMQKAEMSTQFSAMVKQATRAVAQQQKALASAQKKAGSLKISVDSLMAKWQKAVDDMTQGIAQARQLFQEGNIEDAVEALKDNVFDTMQTLGSYQQTFGMISNSQKMLAVATREMASIEKKIASLKKQGKDTGDAEAAVADGKAKIQAIKDAIAQPDIDPDTLIGAIEDAQEAKEQLYDAMYDLTGQQQYNHQQMQQSIPGLNMQQFQAPPGMQQFFGNGQQQNTNPMQQQGGMQNNPSGNDNRGFGQPMQPPFEGGPQGVNRSNAPAVNPNGVNTASALEAAQKQLEFLKARLKELMK
ncbi:MAG: hypothetical protein HY617_02270 [Candidatus Sungbacteria bacterium]|nr:hypothetical protein [Candidatus Sungbacteria bacterium]